MVVQDLRTRACAFLAGHAEPVSAVALSPCGRWLATGARAEAGVKAAVLLWRLPSAGGAGAGAGVGAAVVAARLVLHRGALQAAAFSRDGALLATLGGADDGLIAVWDVAAAAAEASGAAATAAAAAAAAAASSAASAKSGGGGAAGAVRPLCSAVAGGHAALALVWGRGAGDLLVTAGQFHVRAWRVDAVARRMAADDWRMGTSKRVITCLALDGADRRLYGGTSSGDVLEFDVRDGAFVRASPQLLACGVLSLAYVRGGTGGGEACLVAGSGDGALARLAVAGAAPLAVTGLAEVQGGVTSLAALSGGALLAGTDAGAMYELRVAGMAARLLSTAHATPVVGAAFARTPELLLTAGGNSVRLWDLRRAPAVTELLRIVVDGGAQVTCVAIDGAGASVLSGWSDGRLRAHGPESGTLQYMLDDAHAGGATAVAFTHDGARAVSGGRDGRVRVWAVAGGGAARRMLTSFKEHTKEVTALAITHDDAEAVSASADGSCLIWGLARGTRLRAIFANTVFRALALLPDDSQILTTGSDRRIAYWDAASTNARARARSRTPSKAACHHAFDTHPLCASPHFVRTDHLPRH